MLTREHMLALKPAAPARVHLLVAAVIWTVVGGLLAFFGVRWVLTGQLALAVVLLVVATVAGVLKARFALEKAAGRNIERIRARGDGRCLGGFVSWKTWLLIAAMAVGGRLLRGSALPREAVGFIYTAVGVALLTASRRVWRAWHDHAEQVADSSHLKSDI